MRGSIDRRSDGHFRIRLHLGYDEAGKRQVKNVTVKGTRRDAQKKLAELLHDYHEGMLVKAPTSTVASYLDYWLTHYASRLAARTLRNYTEYVEYYLKPGLGKLQLADLQPLHIQAFYTKLERTGRKKDGSALSATTVFNCHRVFKGALRQAVRWQMLAHNPAEAVTPPRPAERPQRILRAEQVAALLEAASGTRLYVPILLGLSTGMRRGEICGLRWADVDFARGVLAIRQTLVNVGDKHLEFKTPKTRTGRRAVKLPTLLVEVLAAEKARQAALRATFGSSYNEADLVVCREDGRFAHPATLYSGFQKILIRLGLPRMAFHDLRHSHATQLLEQGVNPKTVAERLGHADPALTLRVYSHVLDHIQQEAADQTDAYLRDTAHINPPITGDKSTEH